MSILLLRSMVAQWPAVAGKGPESLFEDIFIFLRVVEVILPTGPAMDLNHLKLQVKLDHKNSEI